MSNMQSLTAQRATLHGTLVQAAQRLELDRVIDLVGHLEENTKEIEAERKRHEEQGNRLREERKKRKERGGQDREERGGQDRAE